MELANEELAALEEYSAGEVPWRVIEKVRLKNFPEDAKPAMLIEFGGTYMAKTVFEGESVWAVVSKRKGKFFYGAYADTLETLLANL